MLDERQMLNMKNQPTVTPGKRKFYSDSFEEVEAGRRSVAVSRTKVVTMVETPYGPKKLVVLHANIRAPIVKQTKTKAKKWREDGAEFDSPRSAMPGTVSNRQYHGKADMDASRKAD